MSLARHLGLVLRSRISCPARRSQKSSLAVERLDSRIAMAVDAFWVAATPPQPMSAPAGSMTKPFTSLEEAREAIRSRLAAGPHHGETGVSVHGGTSEFDDALTFEVAGSGKNGRSFARRAAPGEKPVRSGSRQVAGWSPNANPGLSGLRTNIVRKADVSALSNAGHTGIHGVPEMRARQTQRLIGFNGVYTLASTDNGFFSVDTDMFVSAGRAAPQYIVTLSVSLDGKTSSKATFEGSFDGRRLTQSTPGGPSFNLTFTRNSRGLGPTATVAGSVTLPGQPPTAITGVTYDNPIPPKLWGGQTYYLPGTDGAAPVPFVRIEKNGDVFYNPNSGQGSLAPVKSYKYNMDEYYFFFESADGLIHTFIMGTAGQAGLTMNNIVYQNEKVVSQRSLVTMPKASAPKDVIWYPELKLTQSGEGFSIGTYTTIADLSGYWQIDSAKSSGAFVAIEGKNLNLAPGVEESIPGSSPGQLYNALISVSLDGKNVSSWYFDMSQGMTFDGRTLRMPRQGIELKITREYDTRARSLYRMTGTIRGRRVTGSSMFNNTPVGAFAGTLTDATGTHEMKVTADGIVELDGQIIVNYVYVPMMYVLAGPVPGTTMTSEPVTLISFGHAGARGMAAIVTTGFGTPAMRTFNMFQVPAGSVST